MKHLKQSGIVCNRFVLCEMGHERNMFIFCFIFYPIEKSEKTLHKDIKYTLQFNSRIFQATSSNKF